MKQRILIGLAPLFILLLAMGASAVSLFAKLGGRVDVILRENFRSVLASQQMKESSQRIDAALIFSLVGEEERGWKLYTDNLQIFNENLRAEMNNITLPGESELVNRLKNLHEAYAARADVFWASKEAGVRRKLYFGEMLPASTAIKQAAQEIVRINQDNMIQADREARRLSAQSTRAMIVAMALGILLALFFAQRLQRSILRPIEALTACAKELGNGQLDQVVPVGSSDELGQLADSFNKMATKLRAYRQITSDQILQARQMTEITFSAFPDPIIALTPDGRIDFSNPAAHKLFYKLDSKGELPALVQEEATRVSQGAPDYLPVSLEKAIVLRVDDVEKVILPRVIGMRDEAGHILGVAVILQDVTRLRLLDEVKTNLVSTVSHELKTPLTSIRMGLHLLLEERIGTLTPKQTELLLAAREDSERLLRMINDLLDLAKLESGRPKLPLQVAAPGELIESAIEESRGLAESHGLQLKSDIAPGLPSVAVDQQQIAHVFSNFISNAVKHTNAPGDILIKARENEGKLRFSVIDNGPGVPQQYQAQLFERFFRVPGMEQTGAGLGLAIAKETVIALGGEIGVLSKPGEGSEFYFDLPIPKETTI